MAGLARFGRERPDFVARRCWREIEARGPLARRELTEGGTGRGAWWGWSDGKHALEWLFWAGRVTTARAARLRARLRPARARAAARRSSSAPTPAEAEAQRELLRDRGPGARRRHRARPARLFPARRRRTRATRLAELVEAGGADRRSRSRAGAAPAYLDPAARRPRRIEARALVCAVRPADLGARAHRAAVRLPLPHRDLHPGPQARARLLRAAVPARRPARRRGSTSRPTGRRGACSCRRPISSRAPIRRASDRRSARSSAPSPAGLRSTRSLWCRRGRGSISASESTLCRFGTVPPPRNSLIPHAFVPNSHQRIQNRAVTDSGIPWRGTKKRRGATGKARSAR